jgi:hypothetical protein
VCIALNNQVPWVRKMRRLHPQKAEWMAPDEVVEQVRADYLLGLQWLAESVFWSKAHQLKTSHHYLAGECLAHHHELLSEKAEARFIGVLRADHHVEVRHFTEDGDTCLLIDIQAQRRMATYDARMRQRLLTQDLGSGAAVYRMTYDTKAHRWKIEAFVQELPLGWSQNRRQIQEVSELPTTIGRDN